VFPYSFGTRNEQTREAAAAMFSLVLAFAPRGGAPAVERLNSQGF
jgi:hypothetical protein